MKRFQLAAGRIFTKTKDTARSPEAAAAIVRLLKIAATINVPFCQTACTAAITFIEMGEAAGTNDRQWKMLLDFIGIYVNQISEFIATISEGHPPDYIVVSNELRAKIAREAVKDFETYGRSTFYFPLWEWVEYQIQFLNRNIANTKEKIEKRLGNGKIKKRLAATVIQEEIAECRQAMAIAQYQFMSSRLNILNIAPPQPPTSSASLSSGELEYGIPGARALCDEDIEIVDYPEIATLVQDSFWTNIVGVKVHGTVRIAKIYSTSNGGKAKFEKDLDFLANHWLVSGEAQGTLSGT
ncbi:hypothetical protein FRC01_001155 [Tulasnella sp. 417]|nr:hypothetical protein FRC01_001155 [Tulasnella sp. 417]